MTLPKEDFYYGVFCVLSSQLATTSLIISELGSPLDALAILFLAIASLSMGMAAKYDGHNSRLWSVMTNE